MGKSTLMDSLFNTSFESTPATHTLSSVKLKSHTYELSESNVRLKVREFSGEGGNVRVKKGNLRLKVRENVENFKLKCGKQNIYLIFHIKPLALGENG